MNRERGNIGILALAGMGLALVLAMGITRVGEAAVLQARADTAADAAALAGADALALGRTPAAATLAARAAAADNGGRLTSCSCADEVAEVVVRLGRARGRARAEVSGFEGARGLREAGFRGKHLGSGNEGAGDA